MTNYMIGISYKYKLMELIKKRDTITVQRTAGSHGFFDVVAVFYNRVEFYQVKKTNKIKPYFDVELTELEKIKTPPNTKKFLSVYYVRNPERSFYGWDITEVK